MPPNVSSCGHILMFTSANMISAEPQMWIPCSSREILRTSIRTLNATHNVFPCVFDVLDIDQNMNHVRIPCSDTHHESTHIICSTVGHESCSDAKPSIATYVASFLMIGAHVWLWGTCMGGHNLCSDQCAGRRTCFLNTIHVLINA